MLILEKSGRKKRGQARRNIDIVDSVPYWLMIKFKFSCSVLDGMVSCDCNVTSDTSPGAKRMEWSVI
jgi:hypothetical protein